MPRTILMLLAVWIVATISAGGQTNEVTVLTHQSRHQGFAWKLPEQELLADRTWDIENGRIPLAPKDAAKLAKEWMLKRHSAPELASIKIQSLGVRAEVLRGHYVYVVEFITGFGDSMVAVILMNGTIVEPTPVPRGRDIR